MNTSAALWASPFFNSEPLTFHPPALCPGEGDGRGSRRQRRLVSDRTENMLFLDPSFPHGLWDVLTRWRVISHKPDLPTTCNSEQQHCEPTFCITCTEVTSFFHRCWLGPLDPVLCLIVSRQVSFSPLLLLFLMVLLKAILTILATWQKHNYFYFLIYFTFLQSWSDIEFLFNIFAFYSLCFYSAFFMFAWLCLLLFNSAAVCTSLVMCSVNKLGLGLFLACLLCKITYGGGLFSYIDSSLGVMKQKLTIDIFSVVLVCFPKHTLLKTQVAWIPRRKEEPAASVPSADTLDSKPKKPNRNRFKTWKSLTQKSPDCGNNEQTFFLPSWTLTVLSILHQCSSLRSSYASISSCWFFICCP